MKFKVIAPKGVNIDGKLRKTGEVIEGEKKMARISTPLHFKQIEELPDAPEADPEADAKAALEKEQAAAKAKEEADAKAKAEADAKAKTGK